VAREEASKFEKKSKQGKDNRNLKFLRVSLIRQGTEQVCFNVSNIFTDLFRLVACPKKMANYDSV
jgi:hypothetical protein